MVSDDLVAVLAAMLLIVAHGDAEWDKTTSEPASESSDDTAEDPGKYSLGLVGLCDAGFAAELAINLLW